MTAKEIPIWAFDLNGIKGSLKAWNRSDARRQLRERFGTATLPRKLKLRKV